MNNRLVYDGTKTRTFIVTAAISASGTSSSNVYSFYIFKNGAEITASRQRTKVSSTVGDVQIITIVCTVTLSPGDYVEVWTENNSSAIDINVQNMTLSIK
jgi:sulfite reductase alpha subunit-like flavoprotein